MTTCFCDAIRQGRFRRTLGLYWNFLVETGAFLLRLFFERIQKLSTCGDVVLRQIHSTVNGLWSRIANRELNAKTIFWFFHLKYLQSLTCGSPSNLASSVPWQKSRMRWIWAAGLRPSISTRIYAKAIRRRLQRGGWAMLPIHRITKGSILKLFFVWAEAVVFG